MRLTPGEAIRKLCLDCSGTYAEVEKCEGDTSLDGPCPFYRYRLGKGRPSVKTIRKACLSCMGGSSKLVEECKSTGCFVYEFRFGKNPAFEGRMGNSKGSNALADYRKNKKLATISEQKL